MKRIATFLSQNPQANITVHPMVYEEKEKEYILFYEAKKKYYLSHTQLPQEYLREEDSLKIEKLSVKDSLFVSYVNNHIKDTSLFTIQDKCYSLISVNTIEIKYEAILKFRNNVIMKYFEEDNTEKQVQLYPNKSIVPFSSFSHHKISYKGKVPKELVEAYKKLKEFNDNAPRDKYKKFRKTTF